MSEKRKILVVDDDPDILEVVSLILEDEGFEVDRLGNGEKVFEHIHHFQPDLIILDIMLGNADGREICGAIKSSSDMNHIPVIMISASHNIRQTFQKSCRPDDFIEKPFDIVNLINKVEHKLSA